MKRIISGIIVFTLISVIFSSDSYICAAEVNYNRVINVVYDDSGSMINTDGANVDTWCQAKYAMEVFAAMLGPNDTMNVYVMSDYYGGKNASTPKLVLKGSNSTESNVASVHNMITRAGGTPFASVKKAYSDLINTTADEKWLVVLTDGEFEGASSEQVQAFFDAKSQDVNVMFLGMGGKAAAISTDENNKVFFEKAETNSEILNKITEICTRVFNSHKLSVDISTKEFEFDVPMSELVVFAQGTNVKINGLKTSDGTKLTGVSSPVSVKYSETAATNYTNVLVAKDLTGSLLTFSGDYSSGRYVVDVTGAETLEIYYKPNVEIAAYLVDADGNEVTKNDALESGEYTINFGFVRKGTDEKVSESKLLGNVSYEASIINNGKKLAGTYNSGDRINIEEGELGIDVTAYFLEYNKVSTSLKYSIFRNKVIDFEVLKPVEYLVNTEPSTLPDILKFWTWKDYLVNEGEPTVLKLTVDGREFTETEWNLLSDITIKELVDSANLYEELVVEKTKDIGIVNLYLAITEGDTYWKSHYYDLKCDIEAKMIREDEEWSGKGELIIPVKSERPIDFILDFIGIIISGFCLFIIAGYLFKKKLPNKKKMKGSPKIICKSNSLGVKDRVGYGEIIKIKSTYRLPYIPQRAIVYFVPGNVQGISTIEIMATGHDKFKIVNAKDFVSRNDIRFNGVSFENGNLKREFTHTLKIEVDTYKFNYKCTLCEE